MDETLDGFGGFRALPLLEFTDPVGDSIHHVARRLASRLGFVWLADNALGAFHDFYFFL